MIKLRPFQPEDIEHLKIWLNKDYIKDFFGEPEEWITEIVDNSLGLDWVYYYIVEYNNAPIGFTQYYETHKAPDGDWSSEPEGTVGIDYLIGDESLLSKGLGYLIIQTLIDEIKLKEKYKYIIADPNLNNIASIKVLEKNGFEFKNKGLYRLII